MAQLSISDVRREIVRAAGAAETPSASSTALAGQLFHQVLAAMMGPLGWQAALEPGELGDHARLARHTYDILLGPRITEWQASLREAGAETVSLWEATREMCAWLCSLLAKAESRGLLVYDRRARSWQGGERICSPEHALEWELREPGWTAPVQVSGVADALWANPETGRWCVVEYKLGQGHPEADLAQACLYHAMLSASGLGPADGALSLLAFQPKVAEKFYSADQIRGAQASLRALIGRLAGVIPTAAPQHRSPAGNDAHTGLGHGLVRALEHYGIQTNWNGEITTGPAFLRYPLIPGRSVRIKSIIDRAEDLQVQLGLEHAPMIHKSGGRLVIDVQRPDRQVVPFSSVASRIPRPDRNGCTKVPLGVDLNGELQFADLSDPVTAHLLVAGTTGSGKTEWLRAAIAGLLMANTPETLRLMLIDPKRAAFQELARSPFLLSPDALVYPPQQPAAPAFERLIEEMEERYVRFSEVSASDLAEYRAKTGRAMPRIVCVCDEYADLIAVRTSAKAVELAIGRLGAKARAAGIHLIVATQYPDRKTVGGALSTNLGGRVCLLTKDHIQSKMILGQSGAQNLLGKGDVFFSSVGDPVRLQAPYLAPEDRVKIFGAPATTSANRT